MNRSEWLLLFLGLRVDANRSPALDPVRIQKGMFLLAHEAGLAAADVYDFEPYNWGPYSRTLRADLNGLVRDGLVQTRDVPGYSWKRYALTAAGADVARNALGDASTDSVQKLLDIKQRVSSASFNDLLKDVYAEYPEYAVNSLFQP